MRNASTCIEAARDRWPEILCALTDIDAALLDGKPHECPICGTGTDRFTFDNRDGRGTWICRQCPARQGKAAGAGDGMELLQAVTG
jgi:putative DNA primase/helicase